MGQNFQVYIVLKMVIKSFSLSHFCDLFLIETLGAFQGPPQVHKIQKTI